MVYYQQIIFIEREIKESSTEDLVVGRDQVKQKKSPLRRQLLETGVVFLLNKTIDILSYINIIEL